MLGRRRLRRGLGQYSRNSRSSEESAGRITWTLQVNLSQWLDLYHSVDPPLRQMRQARSLRSQSLISRRIRMAPLGMVYESTRADQAALQGIQKQLWSLLQLTVH